MRSTSIIVSLRQRAGILSLAAGVVVLCSVVGWTQSRFEPRTLSPLSVGLSGRHNPEFDREDLLAVLPDLSVAPAEGTPYDLSRLQELESVRTIFVMPDSGSHWIAAFPVGDHVFLHYWATRPGAEPRPPGEGWVPNWNLGLRTGLSDISGSITLEPYPHWVRISILSAPDATPAPIRLRFVNDNPQLDRPDLVAILPDFSVTGLEESLMDLSHWRGHLWEATIYPTGDMGFNWIVTTPVGEPLSYDPPLPPLLEGPLSHASLVKGSMIFIWRTRPATEPKPPGDGWIANWTIDPDAYKIASDAALPEGLAGEHWLRMQSLWRSHGQGPPDPPTAVTVAPTTWGQVKRAFSP